MASRAKNNGKKNSQQNPPNDLLRNQIRFKTIERGMGLPCVSFKNRSTGRGSEDQSEPSPRFASNGIHMKDGQTTCKATILEEVPVLAKSRSEMGAKTQSCN